MFRVKTLRGIFNGKGFTLIELVMVITLMGIIAGVIAFPLYQGTKGWFEATTREGITESGRIAMERMMREVRNAAKVDSVTALCAVPPCPCIASATATSFTFSDMNGDLTNCNSINFAFSGTDIQRSGVKLADNVQSLTLTYYDSANAPTGVAANVRRVAIEIVSTTGGETLRKYSEVYLSNMKGY